MCVHMHPHIFIQIHRYVYIYIYVQIRRADCSRRLGFCHSFRFRPMPLPRIQPAFNRLAVEELKLRLPYYGYMVNSTVSGS